MKRLAVLASLLIVGALPVLMTQGQAQQNVAEIQKVKDNLYMISGGGGNTAAFITDKGVVVVDTKLAKWGQAILDKIKSVTDKPVTIIINTHTHGDHVGSNNEFPGNIEFVAHENCKASMEKMPQFQGEEGKKFLPHRTYKDKMSLLGGKDKVDLYYFGRGHTSGDTIIVFPALKDHAHRRPLRRESNSSDRHEQRRQWSRISQHLEKRSVRNKGCRDGYSWSQPGDRLESLPGIRRVQPRVP